MRARILSRYDTRDWENFQRQFIWRQGEHLIAVAPTGGGKTTLISAVLPKRDYVCVLVTKRTDPTFQKMFPKRDWPRISHWPPPNHIDRFLLWPEGGKTIPEFVKNQHAVFDKALNDMFFQGGWTIVCDEEHYLSQRLKLAPHIETILHQGRSAGISMVNGTQRPAWVPVVTYSSADHAFVWKTTDETDLKRLSNLGGVEQDELRHNLRLLGKHEFIYVPARAGRPPIRSQVRI